MIWFNQFFSYVKFHTRFIHVYISSRSIIYEIMYFNLALLICAAGQFLYTNKIINKLKLIFQMYIEKIYVSLFCLYSVLRF